MGSEAIQNITHIKNSKQSSESSVDRLEKLGFKAGDWDFVVALAGNPNTGKSTIFNQLTGLRQHVGNWAGKTVTRAEGAFSYGDKSYKIVDLPGTYSLLSASLDEEIARDFLLFGKPDVTVITVDATSLERNLGLTLQILEITGKSVVALNLIDEARRKKIKIDTKTLEDQLGVPVIPMAARHGEGVEELLVAIRDVATGKYQTKPHHINYIDENLEKAVEKLVSQLNETFVDLPNARWVALRLIEGDESIIKAVREKTLGEIRDSKQFDFPQKLVELEAK